MSRSRWGLVLVALAAAGCAQRADTASDGGGDLPPVPEVTTVQVTTAPATPPATATEIPQTGACRVAFDVDEVAKAATPGATTTPATSRELPGDMPPNHVDNRSWRVRKALRPEVRASTLAVAEKVRPGLDAGCDAGTTSPESVRSVFAEAGQPKVWLTTMTTSPGTTPPPGVVYALTLESPQGTGCVIGHVRPGEVLVSVTGPTREGACYEPPSH
ncbi:hypothetical protein AB0I60_33760 [Actinosynnema sp. NPDC050436]|uniref:hypothetical protein n=1 Tax=Actinosynnema sp. NPDC050436 TaxID=3155659 RepID=UPI0033E38345